MTNVSACVLLSGGLDSTACLIWSLSRYESVRAIGFDYGQPHRDQELVCAGKAARSLGIEFEMVALADTMRSGLLDGVAKHDDFSRAINRAFVPGRNLIFLSVALSRACQWFPTAPAIDLVIGACREDTGGFPDCRPQFFDQATKTLSMSVDRAIQAVAPFVATPKADIVKLIASEHAEHLGLVTASWSCYRGGKDPCGNCTACVMRQRALAANEITDASAAPEMCGGDVERTRRLAG